MLILGIDPGTIHVGYGCVRTEPGPLREVVHGTLEVGSGDYPARLRAVFEGLGRVLDACKPAVVVVEEVFFAKNARSAIKIGEGRAVAILCAALRGLPVIEYAANEVKSAVAGNGHAHKTQIQYMVQAILGLANPIASEHAADALALAICHAHRLATPRITAPAPTRRGGRGPGRAGKIAGA